MGLWGSGVGRTKPTVVARASDRTAPHDGINRLPPRSIGLLAVALAVLVLVSGCGIYSFSGSTLPGHLKTVEIPLFANQTLEPALADEVTQELHDRVLSANLLRPVSRGGDATILGVVQGYDNQAYQYDIKGERNVDVQQYMVRIAARVTFVDTKKGDTLYSGALQGQGIYSFTTEKEQDGRKRAVSDLVRQVVENSVQSW